MTAEQISPLCEAARYITVPARYRLFEDDGTVGWFWLGCRAGLSGECPDRGMVKVTSVRAKRLELGRGVPA